MICLAKKENIYLDTTPGKETHTGVILPVKQSKENEHEIDDKSKAYWRRALYIFKINNLLLFCSNARWDVKFSMASRTGCETQV